MTNEGVLLGRLIAKWRRNVGLSQASLAEAVGTQQATISKFETGAYKLSIDQLLLILNACGLTLKEVAVDIENTVEANDKPLWERVNE